MSEPTTAAGRAMAKRWFPKAWYGGRDVNDDIVAIEQEAIRAERERIAAEVEDCRATENVPEFRAAVLALITPEDHDAPD